MTSNKKIVAFRHTVWKFWEENGRHELAWRRTKDPYRILISEVMLQQTQVSRVIEKYKEFLKAFPNIRALAEAPLSDVLKVWSGLGYNRRAKYLHDAAREVVGKYGGKVPRDFAALRALSGVGDYTASAVRVFAFNEPDILIETNIRTAFIHHLFPNVKTVSDKKISTLLSKVGEGEDPRKWCWALMDYGAYLKRSGVRNNSRSAHYTKQSKFEGSLRQVRGTILRELHTDSQTGRSVYSLIVANSGVVPKSQVRKALAGLVRDGLIVKVRPRRIGLGPKKGKWRIA
jgi:A/G-specific adenine glycosylase